MAKTKYCPHCRKLVIPSEVDGYDWQCLECDEDFYDCETYDEKGNGGLISKMISRMKGE